LHKIIAGKKKNYGIQKGYTWMAPDDMKYLQRVYTSIAPEIAGILHTNYNLFFMLFSFLFFKMYSIIYVGLYLNVIKM
jgi:hypothetical protein